MKKFLFLVCVTLFAVACSQEEPIDDGTKLPITGEVLFKVNGQNVAPSDTLYFISGETATFEILMGQKKVVADWEYFRPYDRGTMVGITFNLIGKSTLIASVEGKKYPLVVIVSDKYQLRVNGAVNSAGVIEVAKGQSLEVQVNDGSGTAIYSHFDLGSRQVSGYKAKVQYDEYGTYNIKISFKNRNLSLAIKVIPTPPASVILISSRVDNGFVYGVLGLRAGALPSWMPTKKTYVTGELPGAYWKDYEISDREVIGETTYLKFPFSTLPGKFRISWIQLKDGYTQFHYDNCNWAWDPTSPYWQSDYLFHFYLRIEYGKAVLKTF